MIKTFLFFLLETKPERSKALAHKLLARITRGRSAAGMSSLIPQGDYQGVTNDFIGFRPSMMVKAPIKDIPVEKIYTGQHGVNIASVNKKIDKEGPNSPNIPWLIYHRATDRYHLIDGNHRANAARLLRQPTLQAKVIDW